MSITVGIRELRQNPAGAIAATKAGEIVLVSERGTTVAQLVPPATTHREQMIVAGRIRPAQRNPQLLPPPLNGEGLSERLAAMRAAERY